MFPFIKPAALGLAALASLAPVAAGAQLAGWHGRYLWEESLGRIGGEGRDGVAIFVSRTLTLGPAAGSTGCTLNSEGYQTYEQLKCTATPEGASVVIKLYKFRPTDPGQGPSGTPLFRLTRTGSGLSTQLQALSPSSDATPRSGRLFRRVG